jgi:hypothetical protein
MTMSMIFKNVTTLLLLPGRKFFCKRCRTGYFKKSATVFCCKKLFKLPFSVTECANKNLIKNFEKESSNQFTKFVLNFFEHFVTKVPICSLLKPEQNCRYCNARQYPPLGGGYQPMSFGGKNMKRPREKGGKCRRKRKKGERKRKKGERK